MFNRDNWIEIWSTIKSNKLRSFLTAFGVFWGIFILTLMLGSSTGLKKGLEQNFEGIATNSAFIWSQTTSIAYKGYNVGRRWSINNRDIRDIKTLFPNLEMIAPRISGPAGQDNVAFGKMKGTYNVSGDYPDYFKIVPTKIKKGRVINELDIKQRRKVCLIGVRLYEELFKGEKAINRYLRVNNVYFKVVGILQPKSDISLGSDIESTVFIPFPTLQKTFGMGDVVNLFSFTAKDNVSVASLEKGIKKYLLKKHELSPDDIKAVGSFNMAKTFAQISGMFDALGFLSWFVGIGTLLAGIIGVSNIMLIVIRERMKEIGIKRALGAQSSLIRKQILFESVILTAFSGLFGLVFSVAILELIRIIVALVVKTSFFTFSPQINIGVTLISLSILVVGGALAGMLPASRAIKIRPIDALRDE